MRGFGDWGMEMRREGWGAGVLGRQRMTAENLENTGETNFLVASDDATRWMFMWAAISKPSAEIRNVWLKGTIQTSIGSATRGDCWFVVGASG